VPTIIPPLVTLLLASERSKGRALTEGEVAELVSKSPAVMMDPRHVRALERSRGYSDIEPEHA
jgi:hypothetical protein